MLVRAPLSPAAYSVLSFLLLLVIFAFFRTAAISYGRVTPSPTLSPRDAAANATLGFQKILALSTGRSWRTRGLTAAAAYTGLDIGIPKQPIITSELVEAFSRIVDDGSVADRPQFGAARAWLAHLDILKHIVLSGLDTVLIVEDDIDWDVSIKHQMRLISDAVRLFTNISAADPSPYGHDWDILWIGHCGEHTDPDTERVEYPDATVQKHAEYTGWSDKYMRNIGEGNRLVQRAINPVCSFAYAVTLQGAQNVLKWAGSGQNQAFDIRLMQACRPRLLNVLAVQPEVMHHYTPLREAGYWSQVAVGDGKGVASDEAAFEHVIGGTENILHSARCKVLFDTTCVKHFREQY